MSRSFPRIFFRCPPREARRANTPSARPYPTVISESESAHSAESAAGLLSGLCVLLLRDVRA
jgi:hypothetical protein